MLRFIRMGSKRTKTIWWAIIIITVVTFLGGFVFLLGAGLDSNYRAEMSGAVGTVNGSSISRTDYQNALMEHRELYRRQYGSEPADREEKMLETQVWRSVVIQQLLGSEAKKEGLVAHDSEVLLGMQVTPPNILVSAPAFQTDGKFDPAKYRQALQDPNNNWGPFEEMVRQQIPMRKLQERLASSIKLSEPELQAMYRQRFERVQATLVVIPPALGGQEPVPDEAQLTAAYEKYRSRFATGPRVQLEVLTAPKAFGDEEIRVARELAQTLAQRARAGEDFSALVRDYSEAPDADKGGALERVFRPSEFGPEFGPGLAAANVGDIIDPIRDGGRFMVFRVIERPPIADSAELGLKIAQLVVRVRGNEEGLRQQYQQLDKIQKRASRTGLGRAATENGLATLNTGFFLFENSPPILGATPEALDWAFSAKEGEVSPVFEGPEEYVVVQLAAKRPEGIPARDELTDQLRQVATLEIRIDQAKATADAVARGLAAGQSLEAASAAAGLTASTTEPMARVQPDGRIANAPEMVGALFAAKPGQVVGPIRSLAGWSFGRVEQVIPADTTFYTQLRTQLSTELLQRRQQVFLTNYAAGLRNKAKISDLRFKAALQ